MSAPQLGRLNTLRAIAPHDGGSGMLLDGGEEYGEVLLPKRYVPADLGEGDEIEVFLMLDSEDRPVATTEDPKAMVGEFALLKVIASTRVGTFLDWGLAKDLLLPFGEQPRRYRVGERALVFVDFDEVSGRIYASAKLDKYVDASAPAHIRPGNRVSLRIGERTEIGTRAIVNDRFWGLLHADSNPDIPPLGTRCEGYVARIREPDRLVDLSLEPPGYKRIPAAALSLLEKLAASDGAFLPLHDKSPAEQVRDQLGVSKKVFKQSIGALYKAGKIRIDDDGIRLL